MGLWGRQYERARSGDFPGFTHICAKSRKGKFQLRRKTRRKRMKAKLEEIKLELRRRRHEPVAEQGRWLA